MDGPVATVKPPYLSQLFTCHDGMVIDRIHLDSLSLTLIQEDEREWREKMGKSKSKGNFVALVSTRTLTSKAFCPVRAAFDSRSFLTWKVVTRVDDWCRTSSG